MRYAVVRLDTGEILTRFVDFADAQDELDRADLALFLDEDEDDPDLAVLDDTTGDMAELDGSGAFVWSWWDAFTGTWRRKLEVPA